MLSFSNRFLLCGLISVLATSSGQLVLLYFILLPIQYLFTCLAVKKEWCWLCIFTRKVHLSALCSYQFCSHNQNSRFLLTNV